MKRFLYSLLCTLLCVAATTAMAQDIAMSPFGYCGTSVTGGGNTTPTLVSTLSEFKAATVKGTTSRVVIVTQDIEFNALYTIQDTENMTILALPGVKLFSNEQNATNSGILYFKRCNNIILRNITFEGPGAYDCDGNDCLCFQDVTNSWVDHCDFQDGCDGNFDNKNGTDNITVSWCRFHYLKPPKSGGSGGSADHRYTNLLGSSSTDKPSDGTYNMTWAYCWWDEGCKERMLRCRNASLHFLGSYWNSSVANYYIGPENTDAYIELCTFEGKPATDHIFYQNYGGTNGATFVNSVATKGLPTNVTNRTVLVPPYSAPKYSTAAEAKAAVKEYAGATLQVDEQGNITGANTALNTPVITENLASSATAYVGSEQTLSISASYAESYQWYRNTSARNSGGTPISGATSSTYSFTPSAVGTFYYYCVATNSQATGTKSVASAVCTLTVSNAPTMWTAASATYNSTSKGYEVNGVGTFYKSTSGGTTTVNTDNDADWIAGKGNIKTGSSLFIFSPATAITGLKLYVKDTSTRTLSSTECSSTLNGTYSVKNSTADKSVSSYTDVTITFNSTVAANQFIKITFSGNVNVYGIEPITSSTPTPTPTLYTVTYNANGHGTCSTASWTQTNEGQSTNLPSVTAASGYTFLGWATSSSATSAQYSAGANYTPSADVTLYAVYQQEQQGGGSEETVEYTLANNGKTAGSANTGTSYTIPGTYIAGEGNASHTIGQTSDKGVKMRTGNASFSNTSTSLDGKKKFEIDVNSGYTITAITFKAANNYANTSTMTGIYVDGDYSNNLLSSSITFNSEKTAAEGSVSGFTANEKIEFAMETTTVGDVNGTQINFLAAITYKTASTPATYTVTYNLNGHGTAIPDVTGVTALPETLPTPTASGYTFSGWYTDSGLTTPAVAGATISANTTLYAKWTSSSNLSSMTWAQVCDGKMGDTWYGTDEAQGVADIVLDVQKNNGGWMKNDQLHKLTTTEYNTLKGAKGEHSCFDNYATTQEMRFLLKVYKSTGEQKYLDAFKRALNLIITAGQGKQGGWGQYWPNSGGDSYQDYITFNDDLMTNVMKMLQNVYEAKGEYADIVDDATKASCKTAWDAAIQCVLNCQIDDNGTKAIWCAQHDPADFLPAEGRPHEMPSAGPYESSNLLSYLMSIKNPSDDLKTSIRAAVEWMKNHKSFENKAVEDYTNSSSVADRHIVEKQGSNLWGRFIQIGGTSGTAIYNKLWNKLKTRGKKRAHHTTGTEYYEYQLLDASYDASKAYKPIYAIYTNDYPELFYRHLYNYDDTPDATDKYGALVATSLKAANRRSYQYLGSWPDAIINTEYPAWEQRMEAADFGGDLTDVEISTATYSSSSEATWNFSDGFVVTNASNKGYAAGVGTTVKFSAANYTVTIPVGYKVKKVLFNGYSNATSNAYISNLNGSNYSNSQYVFPAKDSNGTTTYKIQKFDLSSNPVEGTLTFGIGGAQTCLTITLYCTTGDDAPSVSEEKTFTFVPNDGTTTNSGSTYTRTSVANPSFSITSSKNISSDSRFKLNEEATYYLNVPSNATVTKVEFTNCSENYYNNPNSGDNNTTTFTVASEGATVVTKDKNGDVLQYLSTGQLITSTITNHVTGTPISFTASGGRQLAFGSIVVYYTLTDKGSLNLLSQSISNGASVNRNGSVTFVFDDDVALVNNAKIKVNGQDVRTEVSGSSVTGYFWDLTYGSTGNTITLAANSIEDGFGNKYADPISITFNVNSKAPVTKKAFDYIVGRDGTTVDAAVTAINNASGTDRYYVFIPDGEYEMQGNQSNKMTWITRANVSLIGQSQNGTVLKNTPTTAGISTTSTIEFRGNNNYMQDLTLKNQLDYGASGSYGVGVAFYDRGQKNILKNVSLLSNQDTYTSAGSRGYFENCKIAGTVDFICGSGDYYFNGCELIINNRTTANVITAPSTLASERWGYVFESCTVSAENDAAATNQGGKYNLGRPWKDAPASTYLNTTFNLLPSNAGWTEMTSGLTVRFHEYGSMNSSGAALSLSSRSILACKGATADNPVLTAAQAAEYTMHNVIGGTDGFDPTEYTEQVAVANIHLSGGTLTWDANDYAMCWVVFKDGEYYANPITNSLALTESGTYTVRAANAMGGLGEESAGVEYENIPATSTVVWDFAKYTSQVSPNNTLEYSGLTLVGNIGSESDYVSALAGFHMNGTSTTTTRYIKYTPQFDGTITVSYKSNNATANDRITAIGTEVVKGTDVETLLANPKVLAAGVTEGATIKTISADLTAGTTYYLYFANGGQAITKIEYSHSVENQNTLSASVLSTRKFSSFSSLYNVDFGTEENAVVQAYTVKVKDATSVVLTRFFGVLPAGEGVVLYAPDATKSQTFNVAASATALATDNDMIGVPVATNVEMEAAEGHAYVVNSDAFRPLSQSGTIAAGKAYIRIPSSTGGAKAISMIFNDEEEATSISNYNFFNTNLSNMKIYNLQGVEVKNPIRGHIYIINNKKCIFK